MEILSEQSKANSILFFLLTSFKITTKNPEECDRMLDKGKIQRLYLYMKVKIEL